MKAKFIREGFQGDGDEKDDMSGFRGGEKNLTQKLRDIWSDGHKVYDLEDMKEAYEAGVDSMEEGHEIKWTSFEEWLKIYEMQWRQK